MTVHQEADEIIFECDGCADTLETDTSNWDDALEVLRKDKWKAERKSSGWNHYCLRCADKRRIKAKPKATVLRSGDDE